MTLVLRLDNSPAAYRDRPSSRPPWFEVEVRQLVAEDTDVADFMVMGGYGHSLLREFVLGGATRGILQTMTVRVLMAH
jgi:hypothetical protein